MLSEYEELGFLKNISLYTIVPIHVVPVNILFRAAATDSAYSESYGGLGVRVWFVSDNSVPVSGTVLLTLSSSAYIAE